MPPRGYGPVAHPRRMQNDCLWEHAGSGPQPSRGWTSAGCGCRQTSILPIFQQWNDKLDSIERENDASIVMITIYCLMPATVSCGSGVHTRPLTDNLSDKPLRLGNRSRPVYKPAGSSPVAERWLSVVTYFTELVPSWVNQFVTNWIH